MSTNTPVGLPIPEQEDILSPEEAFGSYALAADSLVIPRFTTTAARDSAFSAGVTEGMMCSLNEMPQVYDGTSWHMLNNIVAFNPAGADHTLTSTTTFADHAEIFMDLPVAGTYRSELVLFCSQSAAVGNLRALFRWTQTSGTYTGSIGRSIFGAGTITSVGTNVEHFETGTLSNSGVAFAANTALAPSATIEHMTFVCSAPGRLTLAWAPSINTATSVTIKAGSYVQCRRIA